MIDPTTYVIQSAPKSHCSECDCGGSLDLLISDDMKANAEKPIFYICWKHRRVSEAGRGPVPREG